MLNRSIVWRHVDVVYIYGKWVSLTCERTRTMWGKILFRIRYDVVYLYFLAVSCTVQCYYISVV